MIVDNSEWGQQRRTVRLVLNKVLRALAALIIAVIAAGFAEAQSRRTKPAPAPAAPSREEMAKLAEEASEARVNLIEKTQVWRESLEQLLDLQRKHEIRLAADVENKRKLLELGIIAKRELDEVELKLLEAGKAAADTAAQIESAGQLVVEVEAAEELAKNQPEPAAGITSPGIKLIRYTGSANFSLIDHVGIDEYFRTQFGRSLPVSALGQTVVHDRMGFDHRGALDVALHPDSAEGQALMNYLRSKGIPFLAFRGALAGSATGAHIHIGPPSHRITR